MTDNGADNGAFWLITQRINETNDDSYTPQESMDVTQNLQPIMNETNDVIHDEKYTPQQSDPVSTIMVFTDDGGDAGSFIFHPLYAILLCTAVGLCVCYVWSHPGFLTDFTKGIMNPNQEASWMAVHTTVEEDEDGRTRRVDVESDSAAGKGELLSEHERARVISVRYRELRATGMSASESMAKADLETPRRRKVSIKQAAGNAEEAGVGLKETVETAKPNSSLPPLPQASPSSHLIGIEPRCDPDALAKLVEEEAKLSKFRTLRKEGYDEKQARFLAGLPREPDDEEFLWSEVQDEVNQVTYYWDGEEGLSSTRPDHHIWRVVVVFSPGQGEHCSSDGEEELGRVRVQAKEFEFGKGAWKDRGPVALPPKMKRVPPKRKSFAQAPKKKVGVSAGMAPPTAKGKTRAGGSTSTETTSPTRKQKGSGIGKWAKSVSHEVSERLGGARKQPLSSSLKSAYKEGSPRKPATTSLSLSTSSKVSWEVPGTSEVEDPTSSTATSTGRGSSVPRNATAPPSPASPGAQPSPSLLPSSSSSSSSVASSAAMFRQSESMPRVSATNPAPSSSSSAITPSPENDSASSDASSSGSKPPEATQTAASLSAPERKALKARKEFLARQQAARQAGLQAQRHASKAGYGVAPDEGVDVESGQRGAGL